MNKKRKIIAGAVIGTVLGSLSAVLRSKRNNFFSQMSDQAKDWSDKAHYLSQKVLNGVDHWNTPHESNGQTFASGAFVGLLIGLGSALLLAPKSGKQLRNELAKTYHTIAGKTQDLLHSINHEPIARHRPAVKHPRHPTKTKSKTASRR